MRGPNGLALAQPIQLGTAMTKNSAASEDGNDMQAMPARTSSSPRYTFPAPTTWTHFDGPLHALLEVQEGRCAVCFVKAKWNLDDPEDDDVVVFCSLRQWVEEGLLLGLACALCLRRYKTQGRAPVGPAVDGLPAFLADPPGLRCPATAGNGQQARPRPFNARLAPTEEPTSAWRGSNTVSHALFLWQRGRCAICSTGLSVATRPRYVHIDHDPGTDLIRGLLCHRCNVCLGQNWPLEWWEHHAPVVRAYLEFPPAKIFPATRGLTMSERHRSAVLEWSADREEILLDGMPKGIATLRESQAATPRWYAIQYAADAPPGLPPAVEASVRLSYSDAEGEWLAFLMDPPASATDRQRRCILRVNAAHVLVVSEHASLQEALAAAFPSAA